MDKIVCFGKNYADHMTELGDRPVDKPVIFLKPPSILKQCSAWNETLALSLTSEETHYECELVLKLKHGGYRLTPEAAKAALGWYTVGLDMTLRQIQTILKKAGHPWTAGKVFPDAAVIGPWLEIHDNFLNEDFSFSLNQKLKQKSSGAKMLFNPIELIVYASQFFPLCEGDILFTGTPSGVGMVQAKDVGLLEINHHKYGVVWESLRYALWRDK